MKIVNTEIKAGQTKQLKLSIAKLISGSKIDVPVIVSRAQLAGPTILLMAGLHGDEINSVDIIRSILANKINQVQRGTVICMPIANIFGFINYSRAVPDGKDVNRSFPGTLKGSLASQIAYHLRKKILPHCDYIIDFHTGGKSRFNIPQTRAVLADANCYELAQAFNAPFNLHSKIIANTLRETAMKLGKTIVVFEGGEALRFDANAKNHAISGVKKVLQHLNMQDFAEKPQPNHVLQHRKWLRAPVAGFFHSAIEIGQALKFEQHLGTVTGPLADYKESINSPKDAYVISLNNNPMVNRGDAIIQIAF